MADSFAEIIMQALKSVGYIDKKDNGRFKATLMDISSIRSDFSSEIDYLISVADDEFMRICSRTINCPFNQIESIKKKASTYLQTRSFHTNKNYADMIADQTVEGFFLYAGRCVTTERSKARNAVGSRQKHTWILIAFGVVFVALATFLIMTALGDSEDDISVHDNEVKPENAVKYENNYYLVMNEPMYWHEAKDACENMGGHLSTVTSQGEQDFLAQLIEQTGTQKNYWLGGTDANKEGKWEWITGEPWTYDHWRSDQPNNLDDDNAGQQNYLQIDCGSMDSGRYMHWSDNYDSGVSFGYEGYPAFKDTKYTGYICEWEPK